MTLPPAEAIETPIEIVDTNAGETRSLALASTADLSDLSDGNLQQLMNEMGNFDALPASELEPVIAVDSVDSL